MLRQDTRVCKRKRRNWRMDGTWKSSLSSPTTDRRSRSPNTCCCTVRFRRLLLLTLVVILPPLHFTPKVTFTRVYAERLGPRFRYVKAVRGRSAVLECRAQKAGGIRWVSRAADGGRAGGIARVSD